MCGIKPCASCARKKSSIGKMARRKKSHSPRRRRVGKIRSAEAKNAVMTGVVALAGSLLANVVGEAVAKNNTQKYLKGGVQMAVGVALSLTKNRMAQSAGIGCLVTGGRNILVDAGVKLPGLAGTRIGYPARVGNAPNPAAELTMG